MQIPQLPDHQDFSENVGNIIFECERLSHKVLLISVPCKKHAERKPYFLQLYLYPMF